MKKNIYGVKVEDYQRGKIFEVEVEARSMSEALIKASDISDEKRGSFKDSKDLSVINDSIVKSDFKEILNGVNCCFCRKRIEKGSGILLYHNYGGKVKNFEACSEYCASEMEEFSSRINRDKKKVKQLFLY